MNDKNEVLHRRRGTISRKAVVGGLAVMGIISAVGIFLFFSKGARDFLGQSGAIAIESFRDVFSSPSSSDIVSEMDFSSSSLAGDGDSSSSLGKDVSMEKEDGDDISAAKSTGTGVRDKDGFRGSNMGTENATDMPLPGIVIMKASSTSEEASLQNVASGSVDTYIDIDQTKSNIGTTTSNAPVADCAFPLSLPSSFSRRVILNEVAWMGSSPTAGETTDHASDREWMELKNVSGGEVPLNGWRILDSSGKIKISFGAGDGLSPGAFLLLSRSGNLVNGVSPDKAYTGTLSNDGDKLAVLDAACGISDFLDASSKWPGGSNVTKQTLERMTDFSWQTSIPAGGTPRAENSAGVPAIAASSSAITYPVDIAIVGDGNGKVVMKPSNITCTISCVNTIASGAALSLTAIPGSGTYFLGWSGGCFGQSACSLAVGGPVSITANFRSSRDALLVADDEDVAVVTGSVPSENDSSSPENAATTSTQEISVDASGNSESNVASTTTSPPSMVNHLVIAGVEIAGAESSNDLVKIYDPTETAVDMSGWKLRKKSSTGSDTSLREFPAGSTIAAGSYFVWANSADGFSQSIGADASSTVTLAANNSVALFDAAGAEVDAVAWGTGTNQYDEGVPYPTNPGANQTLGRRFINGSVVDTDNNDSDFSL